MTADLSCVSRVLSYHLRVQKFYKTRPVMFERTLIKKKMFYLYDDRHKQREKGAIFMRFVYKYYAVVGSI